MLIVFQVIGGLLIGYVSGSIIESLAHQYISDAPKACRLFWRRHPRLCKILLETYFSHHVIHHVCTFRADHITQFSSAKEKEQVDRLLTRHGNHGILIRKGNYATKLHGSGILTFVSPLLGAWPLINLYFSPWVAYPAACTLSLSPILSNWVHPYLHMSHTLALTEAPRLTAWFLKTWYGRALIQTHFLHHRYGDCCYNLQLGADAIFRTYRTPVSEDIIEMKRIGIPLY